MMTKEEKNRLNNYLDYLPGINNPNCWTCTHGYNCFAQCLGKAKRNDLNRLIDKWEEGNDHENND